MFNADGMDQILRDMSAERGGGTAYNKARNTEKYAQYNKQRDQAWEKFSGSLTEEQRKAFIEYDEAESLREGLIQHYIYLQGLKDGITLANAV